VGFATGALSRLRRELCGDALLGVQFIDLFGAHCFGESLNDVMHSLQSKLTESRFLWILFFSFLGLRLLMVVQVPITDSTESRYAEMARKMAETNDWITPQFDYGVPFWAKPPLHTWVSAFGLVLFGVNEFGARIFIYCTACALLWVLYRWAAEFKGKAYALLGSVVLLSSGIFFSTMGAVMTDLMMLFGVVLSMVSFWRVVMGVSSRCLNGYLFFIGLSVGLLAKGPIAVILTALPIVVWVMLQGQCLATWRRLPWGSGVFILLLLVAPWYLAAEIKTPGFLHYFFVGEHFERYMSKDWGGDLYGGGHGRAYGTIWLYWLRGSLPWSLFLLLPIFNFRELFKHGLRRVSPWQWYLILWSLAPLVFFTFAGNVIHTYVLTGLPAYSMIVAEVVSYGMQQCYRRRVVLLYEVFCVCALIVFISNYVTYVFFPDTSPRNTHKFLVEQVRVLSGGAPLSLVLFEDRAFSADFYTRGRCRQVDGVSELRAVLNDSRQRFISMKSGKFKKLPVDLQASLQKQGCFGAYELYVNVPTSLVHVESSFKL
jgi:4-amino-4-deoxy-L-arabinose transferase-like glycosyltransferase